MTQSASRPYLDLVVCTRCGCSNFEGELCSCVRRELRRSRERIPWPDLSDETLRARVRAPLFFNAVDRWGPERGNLGFYGHSGIGKTSAAALLVRRIVAEGFAKYESGQAPALVRVCWATAHGLVQARREHGLGAGEAPLVELAKIADVLALDDLGFEPEGAPVLFEVLDARYVSGRTTIYSSGARPKQLHARIGDATWRRLTERGTQLECWEARCA